MGFVVWPHTPIKNIGSLTFIVVAKQSNLSLVWTDKNFAFLDKTHYDNYLCLVALNKQQIYVERSETLIRKRIRLNDNAAVSRDRRIKIYLTIIMIKYR